jgi:hypothetical protein
LAEGYKSNKDAQKTQWGEVAAAKWHLKAISTGVPEYRVTPTKSRTNFLFE